MTNQNSFLRYSSGLDMTPYCSSTLDNTSHCSDPTSSSSRYDLYGIINHRGTACFGHYTAQARLLAYNDSAKTEIGKNEQAIVI
jgi:ubiquitin C-terminal hydrolase